MDTQKLMQTNMLVRMLAGSQAYGTALPTSDVDYRGLFFAPQEFIRTPFFGMTEITDVSEEDTKYYEINQFLRLFTLANPNILELLYTDRSKIEMTSDPYELLRASADKLLSSKVAFTFSGYAIAQLKRIRGHNKWLNRATDGTLKLRKLYADGSITKEWLETNFSSDIVLAVIK